VTKQGVVASSDQSVEIVLHPIPSVDAKPYIIVVGPDGNLWFCESGTAKIGRLDPRSLRFTEFATPTPNSRPIGIIPGADGNLWFCENAANQVGRITPTGVITEFPLPTPNAGPDGIMLGPDENLWFSEAALSRIGRITSDGTITEFSDGLTPGCRPLSIVVRDGELWFSEYEAGQIGRMTMRGEVTEYPIPTPNSEPRAMVTHPDGNIWFVQTKANGLGRIDRHRRVTEFPVKTPDASLRWQPLVHRELCQQDRMYEAGRYRSRRISDPRAELRCARHHRAGRWPSVLLRSRCRGHRRGHTAPLILGLTNQEKLGYCPLVPACSFLFPLARAGRAAWARVALHADGRRGRLVTTAEPKG
jgi:virginiamycin B lyase